MTKLLCVLTLSIILLLTACGRGESENNLNNDYDTVRDTSNIHGGDALGESDSNVRTLSILAWSGYETAITNAERRINQEWRDRPYEPNLEVTFFGNERWPFNLAPGKAAQIEERLRTMLMAGQGYDIIALNHLNLPLWNWSETGIFLDIWDLIDACDVLHRDDLYVNALEAFSINNRLFVLPFTFGFQYVGINTNLPESIINAFKSHDTISKIDLLRLYGNLMENYPDYNHLQFTMGASLATDTQNAFLRELTGFIDFENRTTTINGGQFADFLELLSLAYPIDLTELLGSYPFVYPRELEILSSRSAFHINDNHLHPAWSLLPVNESPGFNYFMPISDAAGNLRTFNGVYTNLFPQFDRLARLSFPATGNEDLAWYFALHLMEASGNISAWGRRQILSTPIRRSNFDSHVRTSLNEAIAFDSELGSHGIFADSVHYPGTQQQEIENAITRLAAFNEMPVALIPFFPQGLSDGLFEIYDQFLRGLITSHAAAQDMHNRVALWLIE